MQRSPPRGVSDFRFSGVDGRGTVELVRDPRNNNSVAVIRINDPSSGSDGYTFDIEWNGAYGSTPTGGSMPGWGTPSTGNSGRRGWWGLGRSNRISAERAIDLCRAEVRARGERDYGLQNIDITSASAASGRGGNWITGGFRDRSGYSSRASGYRFNCEVDYNLGQVRNVEILRTDGSTIQPGSQYSASAQTYGCVRLRPEPCLPRLPGCGGGTRQSKRLPERGLRLDFVRH